MQLRGTGNRHCQRRRIRRNQASITRHPAEVGAVRFLTIRETLQPAPGVAVAGGAGTLDREAAGRLFRTAWINGIRKHYPGTPKDGYVSSWEDMPEWERQSAQAVAQVVLRFVEESGNGTAKLTREQR